MGRPRIHVDEKAYGAHRRAQPGYAEYAATYHRRWKLAQRYGLTPEEYDDLLAAQDGGCAICGRTPEEAGKNLSVDHDHETDVVRGLLCQPCNLALGQIEYLGPHLASALEYLGGDFSSRT